mmetsp:Transcript_29494/g.26070  ORF Transcript_29494/g.26070 Transcript_29494/m.26070 type:complete len:119 (+) Transcript_29494:539-895(+)
MNKNAHSGKSLKNNSKTPEQRNKDKFYRLYYSLRNIARNSCSNKPMSEVEKITKEVLEELIQTSKNMLIAENENIPIKLPQIREFKYKTIIEVIEEEEEIPIIGRIRNFLDKLTTCFC